MRTEKTRINIGYSTDRSNFPRCARGLIPLLYAYRAFGMAPYKIVPPLVLVRSTFWHIISCCILFTHIAICACAQCEYNRKTGGHISIGIPSILTLISQILAVILPVLSIVTGLKPLNIDAWNRLIRYLTEIEETLPGCNFPFHVKRRNVVAITAIGVIFAGLESTLVYQNETKENLFSAIQLALRIWIVFIVCQAHGSFALIIKTFFIAINNLMWNLADSLEKTNERSVLNESKMVQIKNNTFTKKLQTNCMTVMFHSNIQETIITLRKTHYKLQLTCRQLTQIFGSLHLFLYQDIFVAMVSTLYMQVTNLNKGDASQLVLSSIVISGVIILGGSVAWAAGSTVAAGEEACAGGGPGGALLLAVRGIPAAEREMQLFLVQLRMRAVSFSAGGLFPLDLRFFISLLGSIVGYLVIIVQFGMPENTGDGEGGAKNCTDLSDRLTSCLRNL